MKIAENITPEELDLIDCQVHSEHLESLGAEMISKKEYLTILKNQEK